MFNTLMRVGLAALQAASREISDNPLLTTYVISNDDGAPYITRSLLPRLAGHRVMLHRIHRADEDEHLHNHPWSESRFRILSGGYTETRLVDHQRVAEHVTDGRPTLRRLSVGDVNRLLAHDFHRVEDVMPNTWTVGLIGARVQEWGYLVGKNIVPWRAYQEKRRRKRENDLYWKRAGG